MGLPGDPLQDERVARDDHPLAGVRSKFHALKPPAHFAGRRVRLDAALEVDVLALLDLRVLQLRAQTEPHLRYVCVMTMGGGGWWMVKEVEIR